MGIAHLFTGLSRTDSPGPRLAWVSEDCYGLWLTRVAPFGPVHGVPDDPVPTGGKQGGVAGREAALLHNRLLERGVSRSAPAGSAGTPEAAGAEQHPRG